MWKDDLLDERLSPYYVFAIPPRLLALAWLGWSCWGLFWSWNAYYIAYNSSLRLFPIILYDYLDASVFLVQGTFALFIAMLFAITNKQVKNIVLGYLIAGSVFHFTNVVTGDPYHLLFLTEHLLGDLLLLLSLSITPKKLAKIGQVNFILLLLAIGLVAASEYWGHYDILIFRVTGIIFFWIFLWRVVPLLFPDFLRYRKWYYWLFAFIGILPFGLFYLL